MSARPDLMAAPPHSLDSEQAVLGALLQHPDAIDRIGNLMPIHFYRAEHRTIYAAILRMSGNGQDIDCVTVAEALTEAGDDEAKTGGLAYLGELAFNTPGASGIVTHARIIRERSIERQLLAANAEIADIVRSPGDTQSKLHRAQASIMAITEQAQPSQPQLVSELLLPFVETLAERESGKARGIPSGFADLDTKLKIHPGDMVVIAARPSMGKTAFALQIASHFALDGRPTGVFSMEMAKSQLVDRLVANLGRVSMGAVLSGRIIGEDGDRITAAIAKLQHLPLVIDDQSALSVHELAAKARTMKRKHGIGALVVDYIGLMSSTQENRVQAIGEISRGIKALAKELDLPILLLAQLSRKVEERTDKRPILSDLRDSGDIEQDADSVLMLYRDEYYRPDTQDKGIAEVLIRKQRQGPLGHVGLSFTGDCVRFDNMAHEWNPSPPPERSQGRRFD